jgi:hypothetical protein
MLRKMAKDVAVFLFFIGVSILGFGVAFQGLLYPNDKFDDTSVARIFLRSVVLCDQVVLENLFEDLR